MAQAYQQILDKSMASGNNKMANDVYTATVACRSAGVVSKVNTKCGQKQ